MKLKENPIFEKTHIIVEIEGNSVFATDGAWHVDSFPFILLCVDQEFQLVVDCCFWTVVIESDDEGIVKKIRDGEEPKALSFPL